MLYESISQRIKTHFLLKEVTFQRSTKHNVTSRRNNNHKFLSKTIRYVRRNNTTSAPYAAREIKLPIVPQICLTELPDKIYEIPAKRRVKKKRVVKFEDVRKRKHHAPLAACSDPIQVVQSVRDKFKEDSDDEGETPSVIAEKVESELHVLRNSLSNKSLACVLNACFEDTRKDFEAQFSGDPVNQSTETLASLKKDVEAQVEVECSSSEEISTVEGDVDSVLSFKSLKQTCSSFVLLKEAWSEPEAQGFYPENECKIGDQPELPAFMLRLSNILEHIENVLKEQT